MSLFCFFQSLVTGKGPCALCCSTLVLQRSAQAQPWPRLGAGHRGESPSTFRTGSPWTRSEYFHIPPSSLLLWRVPTAPSLQPPSPGAFRPHSPPPLSSEVGGTRTSGLSIWAEMPTLAPPVCPWTCCLTVLDLSFLVHLNGRAIHQLFSPWALLTLWSPWSDSVRVLHPLVASSTPDHDNPKGSRPCSVPWGQMALAESLCRLGFP